MPLARRILVAPIVLALVSVSSAQNASGIQGRWLGQDGHDFVGDPASIAPNGVQDVHIALSGLPPGKEITFASITGHGYDEWQYNRPKNQFAAVIERKPGGTSADIYFEATHDEKGREFCVKLTFDDQSVVEVFLPGGRADRNLRMKGTGIAARWIGKTTQDHAGRGPGVGPDGLLDVAIGLSKLAKGERVKAARVEDPSGTKWTFGTNPEGHHNAELLSDPKTPTEATLLFQPDRPLEGKALKVTVTYENGKQDSATVTGGRAEVKQATPAASLPKLTERKLSARWIEPGKLGAVRDREAGVAISGLPPAPVRAAVLTDSIRSVWVYRADSRVPLDIPPDARELTASRGGAGLNFFFLPDRDELKTTMTLRLLFGDGSNSVVTFEGGPYDLSVQDPSVGASESVAKPGDDLAALASRGGTVRLTKGVYSLGKPLVLEKPVSIVGEPGATLQFSQNIADQPWTTAIKIHSGGTTLRGFAVRFTGLIRWRNDVSYGPAVIGTTDNFDNRPDSPKPDLKFQSLDLEGPAAPDPKTWEEAPKLMRLRHAPRGEIRGNTLRGGVIELFDGPWKIVGNDYRGTPPSTHTPSVFAVHDPHDVVVKDNRAKPVGPSGKTWRFLVFTQRGYGDIVQNNRIEGIGPRDDDTIPSMNAPEILLTESYHLRFEGKPRAVSPDGRIVAVGSLRGELPRTGDVVSILAGPGAGQYRRVAQRIDASTYLLDAPLPAGSTILSISPGFVNERFEGNTIDAKGGKAAAGMVLSGNHFGTRVINNHIIGAGDAVQIMAFVSESPGIWGWSHTPFFGGLIEGNVFEDSERGARIGVYHSEHAKSNKGRLYMTVSLRRNTVRWSEAFLRGRKTPLAGITLGFANSLDPAEMIVEEKDDVLSAPAGSPAKSALRVEAAVLNGKPVTGRSMPLPRDSSAAKTVASTPR